MIEIFMIVGSVALLSIFFYLLTTDPIMKKSVKDFQDAQLGEKVQ